MPDRRTTESEVRLLALDPSSTRTGYAMMTSDSCVVDAGLIRPQRAKDAALVRIKDMVGELADMIDQTRPTAMIIEVPSGKVARRIAGRAPSGLTIYGFAAGALWAVAKARCKGEVFHVDELIWTGGRSKKSRQREVVAQFPQYAAIAHMDGGYDLADAIGVGVWWFNRRYALRQCGAENVMVLA